MARNPSLDLYAILGVHPNAEDIVIRAAFKALAQRYHPDRFNGSNDEAHRRMADLTNAYETLADPARRRKYDRRRGLSARTATFYFKNPARDRSPGFGALAARAALAKQRQYRFAVYALMVAVVILSAFNIRQHSAQIREFFAGGRAAPAAEARTGPASAISTPSATDTPAPASTTPTTTGGVRILPIQSSTTRPIGSNGADAQSAPPLAADAVASPVAGEPVNSAKLAPHPAAAAPAGSAVSAFGTPDPSGKDLKHASGKSTPARTPAPDVARPVIAKSVQSEPAKSAVARPAVPSRPAPPAPVAPAAASASGESCKDAVAALGLCSKSPTPK